MNAELWGKLPEDILPHILARLPWWSIMKCRLVSKPWHSLLSDPSFLRDAVSSSGPREPCVIVSNQYFYYAIVNSGTQRSHVIPRENMFPMEHSEAERFHLQATAGGLFLMQVSYECRDRFLCNPLNGTRKLLPAIPPSPMDPPNSPWSKLHQPKTWMMVDTSGALRIICLQVRETPNELSETVLWNVHMYDFAAEKWEVYSTDLPGRRLLFCLSATFVGGNLYLMAKCQWSLQNTVFKHRLFRAHSRHMVEMPIHFTDGILMVEVFQYRGALMLVHGTNEPGTGEKRKKPFHVRLWRYDEVFESWDDVVSMPESIVDTFYEKMSSEGNFYFDIEGDTCCFANRLDSKYIVLYHFVRNEWWHVSCSEVVLDFFRRLDVRCRMTYLWQPRVDIVL